MNRTLLSFFLLFLCGSSFADSTNSLLIQPKNGENLEDSKKHTMEYFGCVKNNAIKYSKTGESVDSIAKAAVVSCEPYIKKIAESNIYFLNSSSEGQRRFTDRIKDDGERIATKFAMDEKLKQK